MEDFTGFAGAGFAPTPAAGQLDSDNWATTGWSEGAIAFGDTQTSGDFARGSSPSTTGGIYGADPGLGDGEALLFRMGGSDFTPGTFTLRIQNNTGAPLDDFDVVYDIVFDNDQARANDLNFSYSTDDSTYTPVGALDFTSPEALDALGYQEVNRSTNIPVAVADGDFLYIRWEGDDNSGTGSRDLHGLDNISITGNVAGPTAVNVVTVDADATANGTDTFNTIADAIASFSTGGANEAVNSDATDNVINVLAASTPYVDTIGNIGPATGGTFAGTYEGTDTIVIQGDSSSNRPVVRLLDSGSSGSGINTVGDASLTLVDLILAPAETGGYTDEILYALDNSTVTATNVYFGNWPAGNTDADEAAAIVSGLGDLLDGSRAFDAALLRPNGDGDGIYIGAFNSANTPTVTLTDCVVTQFQDDNIVAVADSEVYLLGNTVVSAASDGGMQVGNTSAVTIDGGAGSVLFTGNGGVTVNNPPVWFYNTVNNISIRRLEISDNNNTAPALWLQADGVDVNIDELVINNAAGDGLEINNGDLLTTNFNQLTITNSAGIGIDVPIDDNDFAGFSNSIIANNAGGNVRLLNGSGTTAQAAITISGSTIYGGSVQLGAGADPFNVASLTIVDSVFAGTGTGLDIVDSVITPDVINTAFVTAGPDALTVDINGTANTSEIINEDPAFVDAANGDFEPQSLDFAGIGAVRFAYAGTEQNAAPTFDDEDSLNGMTGVFLAGDVLGAAGNTQATSLTAFTDGTNESTDGTTLNGLLRDNPGEGVPSASVAYDLVGNASLTADVTTITVTSGWQDGRASHHYDVLFTRDYPVDGSATWYTLAKEVIPVAWGSAYPGTGPGDLWYYVTELTDGTDGFVAEDITGLRFDFYAIGNTTNGFVDPYGVENFLDVDGSGSGPAAAAEGAWIREIDANFTTDTSVSEWMLLNDE